jgi:hypothetical protein
MWRSIERWKAQVYKSPSLRARNAKSPDTNTQPIQQTSNTALPHSILNLFYHPQWAVHLPASKSPRAAKTSLTSVPLKAPYTATSPLSSSTRSSQASSVSPSSSTCTTASGTKPGPTWSHWDSDVSPRAPATRPACSCTLIRGTRWRSIFKSYC